MHVLVAIALFAVGCSGDAPAVTTPSNTRPTAHRDLPDGWVRFDPDPERLECEKWGKHAWQLAVDPGGVQITETHNIEPDSGPPLPFALPKLSDPPGRRHTLAVADGFLVGIDAGEWGGSLHWFSQDGTRHHELAGSNVRGLIALGANEVLVLEGLNHLALREGTASWVERDPRRSWHVAAVTPLDAGPYVFARDQDTVYAVTAASLIRIDRDRRVTVVQPLPEVHLYPNSMVIDDTRRLWITMRGLVLRLTRAGDRFDVEWLVRRGCERAIHGDVACTCTGES